MYNEQIMAKHAAEITAWVASVEATVQDPQALALSVLRSEAESTHLLATLVGLAMLVDGTPEGSHYAESLAVVGALVAKVRAVVRLTERHLPADKSYPSDAVQCNDCGGHGCAVCAGKGWLAAGHEHGRVCLRPGCGKPIPPNKFAVYCSNDCAQMDAK